MKVLTKNQFQKMKESLFKMDAEFVEVYEGFGVNVVQLSTEGALALSEVSEENVNDNIFAWVAACCVDDEANPVFTKDDIRKMPSKVSKPLIDATLRLNGLLSATALEDAEKNSEEAAS